MLFHTKKTCVSFKGCQEVQCVLVWQSALSWYQRYSSPEHDSALWLQGKARIEMRDVKGACESTTRYDELFQNKSRLHSTRFGICEFAKNQ